ncbi:hypothetical protein HZP70_18640 [Elizabethkingia anophelis]|nr:hypothetical protein [Elizabethkingia anophelis]MCT3828716.1 hypothetical protein [Elizabethkingia anophelis]MCT3839556.1 hypothetical protein [Elizabethkingia anophelis]MCT3843200.1 hypothetical protein [Elizabethkingia anophelis]MCT3850364.1 hypothetical protein [Elizabethkingia anophelis]
MKTLLLSLSLVFFSGLVFGQSKNTFKNMSKAELYNLFKNSAAAKNQYQHLTEKERKAQFEKYFCMIKTYKADFSQDSNFLTEKQAEKVFNKMFSNPGDIKPEVPAYEFLDTIWHLQMGSYLNREQFYNTNKKCLNKGEFIW